MLRAPRNRGFVLEALEPRLLLAADGAAMLGEGPAIGGEVVEVVDIEQLGAGEDGQLDPALFGGIEASELDSSDEQTNEAALPQQTQTIYLDFDGESGVLYDGPVRVEGILLY